ncbi:MAG TPA: glycosyltransferase [Acidimicrobiales bacterium]
MPRVVSITLDQFYRPQPGGIATYVRGLVNGLASLNDPSLRVLGIAPTGTPVQSTSDLALEQVDAPSSMRVLTSVWSRWPLGVPRSSDVVHATSLAGPYGGGVPGAVHSVALHDLLWRDEPSASTPRGIRFHEHRLQLLKRRSEVRVILTAPGILTRLVEEGFDPRRLHEVRLGVDDERTTPESEGDVRALLKEHGVEGPFTLYVGTREPRKNLERLREAHAEALAQHPGLGPLVIVGPSGWGGVDLGDAVVLGLVSRAMLKGLYRDAAVFAYVPRAEGWGLPPMEALHEGTRVVASATTPSASKNPEVVLVDPLDVSAIAGGLVTALNLPDNDTARSQRRASVADLTWRNVALDHLMSWR